MRNVKSLKPTSANVLSLYSYRYVYLLDVNRQQNLTTCDTDWYSSNFDNFICYSIELHTSKIFLWFKKKFIIGLTEIWTFYIW